VASIIYEMLGQELKYYYYGNEPCSSKVLPNYTELRNKSMPLVSLRTDWLCNTKLNTYALETWSSSTILN